MSLAMVFLVIGLAFQIFLSKTKSQHILNLISTGVVSIIAIIYFSSRCYGINDDKYLIFNSKIN
jgi:hypothetical protein